MTQSDEVLRKVLGAQQGLHQGHLLGCGPTDDPEMLATLQVILLRENQAMKTF